MLILRVDLADRNARTHNALKILFGGMSLTFLRRQLVLFLFLFLFLFFVFVFIFVVMMMITFASVLGKADFPMLFLTMETSCPRIMVCFVLFCFVLLLFLHVLEDPAIKKLQCRNS